MRVHTVCICNSSIHVVFNYVLNLYHLYYIYILHTHAHTPQALTLLNSQQVKYGKRTFRMETDFNIALFYKCFHKYLMVLTKGRDTAVKPFV